LTPRSYLSGRRPLLLVGVSLAGIAITLRADLATEARANRLHRDDRLADARAIYERHVEADPSSARLRYNLGTTLLRTDEPEAYAELAAGAETADEQQRVRALYNMGLWSLIRATFAPSADSALIHAANAVESNKRALRLSPEHENAKWNLALAQRILLTAAPELGMDDPGNINGPDNIGEALVSPNPQDLAEREGLEDANAAAEEEALAGEDLEPLSPLEAEQIVGTGHRNPSTMIDKLLYREGRARRRSGIYVQGPPW
jgi:tetratricopeptide (TPR) repeat protein